MAARLGSSEQGRDGRGLSILIDGWRRSELSWRLCGETSTSNLILVDIHSLTYLTRAEIAYTNAQNMFEIESRSL
jgi:hypothetical protein